MSSERYAAEAIASQVEAILAGWGMPEASIAPTVDCMIDTDLSGIDSHGVSMLMMYEMLLNEGRLDPAARPEVVSDAGAFGVVDGHHGLGHPAAVAGMDLAIGKARRHGVGAVSVRHSNHFGAVGYYVRLASRQGLMALGTTSTRTPAVAPLGGSTPLLGTNPIAFSAPSNRGEPLVVDMSTSVVAMNKVKAYALQGKELPPGWLIDRDGRQVTDSSLGYELLKTRGATLTLLGGADALTGGHKGFGLSLIAQVLSAALADAAAPGTGREYDDLGHFFLVIDPEAANPGGGAARYVRELTDSLAGDGPDVIIPGEPEARARADRAEHGIPLPDALIVHLVAICDRAGVPFTLAPLNVPIDPVRSVPLDRGRASPTGDDVASSG